MKEVNLTDIYKFLLSKYRLIIFLTFCVAAISSLVALNLKEIYQSDALVQISESSLSTPSQGQSSSGFGGLASLAGIDIGSGGSIKSKTPAYVSAKITSRSFFSHLASFPGVIEGVAADKSFDFESGVMIYDDKKYNSITKEWLRKPSGFKKAKPSDLEAHRIFLQQLSISVDKKTGFITLVFNHSSPFFAKEMLELILDEVNNLQKNEDLIQFEKEMKYLSDMQKTNKLVYLEQSLSLLVVDLVKNQMLADVKDDYLIEYLDKPYMPESRTFPKRTFLVLASTLISMFLIAILLVIHKFVYLRDK
ncbi:Wzz/FepE/Etk N-terminal domain-containing protein [Gammaproteobacteria bacterium]|nr:Wzz/FepE/Etk N-terminal domain-containing protein [Gammaproteobacteria bacterium]